MLLMLVDDSLQLSVEYDADQLEYEDTVCLTFVEDCPKDEHIFKADETRIFLTPDQADQLALALQQVAAEGRRSTHP